MIDIKIYNTSNYSCPKYETIGSAGMDLRADLTNGYSIYPTIENTPKVDNLSLVLKPFKRALVRTGIKLSIPEGYEAQIRPRSGLALKQGITVLNTPGTIDSDYRGEIAVILINLSNEDVTISDGDRIAQLVFNKVERASLVGVSDESSLGSTDRGNGGFGHTGK